MIFRSMSLRLSSSLFLCRTTFTDLCTNLYEMTECRPQNRIFVHIIISIIIATSPHKMVTAFFPLMLRTMFFQRAQNTHRHNKLEIIRIEIVMNARTEREQNGATSKLELPSKKNSHQTGICISVIQ